MLGHIIQDSIDDLAAVDLADLERVGLSELSQRICCDRDLGGVVPCICLDSCIGSCLIQDEDDLRIIDIACCIMCDLANDCTIILDVELELSGCKSHTIRKPLHAFRCVGALCLIRGVDEIQALGIVAQVDLECRRCCTFFSTCCQSIHLISIDEAIDHLTAVALLHSKCVGLLQRCHVIGFNYDLLSSFIICNGRSCGFSIKGEPNRRIIDRTIRSIGRGRNNFSVVINIKIKLACFECYTVRN